MISVVIPTYNRWPVLGRAIESVLEQKMPPTGPPVELIVVDDGSTDGTAKQVRRRFGSRVCVIETANKGVSAARNTGIARASGDWIALLDSDDSWLPGKLAAQWQALADNPGNRFCHTDEIWIRNGVRVNAMDKHAKHGGYIFEYCLPLCVISPSSVMIAKEVFDELGGFDESLPACEDYDYWLRFCATYPVLFIDHGLIHKYGGHADQLSRAHWGMDRFRVQCLDKLLAGGMLRSTQVAAVLDQLETKVRILYTGACKHGNTELIEMLHSLADRWLPNMMLESK